MSRILCLALACFSLAACRTAGPPPEMKRTPVEKPWTKATVEAHEHLWIELSTKRRGIMTGPVLATDEKGEYLTTKNDPSVRLPLAEVVVMDALESPPPEIVRTPIEKPWTKEAVEAHDHVWVETASGTRQIVKDPTVAPDWTDDWLTAKNDPSVRIPMSEVLVLDSARLATEGDGLPVVQTLAGSLALVWIGVLLFLPAALLIVLIA